MAQASSVRRVCVCGVLALVAGWAVPVGMFSGLASAQTPPQTSETPETAVPSHATPESPDDRPVTIKGDLQSTVAQAATVTPPSSDATLAPLVELYRTHLFTLANPYMEGRAPGTEGNRHAANYLEWYYRQYGLEPAFPSGTIAGDDAPIVEGTGKSYRQRFIAPPSLRPGDSVRLNTALLGVDWGDGAQPQQLAAGSDFNVLGFSASATATGPVAFVGYAIEEGEDEYTSFPRDGEGTRPRLDGKIAMVLRFEPMDDEGKSKWSDVRWSGAADLSSKLSAVIELGAVGIVLVNPPGADDPRASQLADLSLGLQGRPRSVPIVMMSNDAADAFIRRADAQGRSLMDLRRVVDERGEVIGFPKGALTLSADIQRIPLWTDNVGAVLPGRGALKDEYIVIGSHYDHVGYGYFGSRDGAAGQGKLHPGADDNASGTSGNLILAKRLSEAYAKLPADADARSILFLQFCAEESGLNGARHYVNHALTSPENHTLMINLDMIGRVREDKVELTGVGTGQGLAEFVQPYIETSGLTVATRRSGLGPSDHQMFAMSNIPVLFFFSGLHEQYHRPTDTPDTINPQGAIRITDTVFRIVLDASTRPEGFPFTSADGRAPGAAEPGDRAQRDQQPAPGQGMGGMRVRFGIAPGDYAGEEDGVLVGSIIAGTPADKAGLKAGDLMTRWNGKKLIDVESWMPMLVEHKPGDEVEITYLRDGKEATTKATLVARDTRGQ